MTNKIYILEDDDNIRELVIYALNSSGFEAQGFAESKALFAALETKELPRLVLLDIMLPEQDGLEVLKILRSSSKFKSLPIIMLTAKSNEYDKIKGLDAGADDYITKPFGVMELISRINAVLRRAVSSGGSTLPEKLFCGTVAIDHSKRAVFVGDEVVALTFKEYELLYYLLVNKNMVLSRDKIMETIWGYDFEGESRTVDMHIKALRKKLLEAGECIKTVRNVGYKISE